MPNRPMVREQMWMLPPTLDELTGPDHPARFVAEFVDALDRATWAELGIDIDGDELGAPAYHPRALLSVWLHGFMTGVRSCRKLEGACRDQIPYLWLTGFQRPDHNTLWRFYKDHRQAMRKLLKHTVRTAVKLGLVDLALQAVDGTKVVANAARERTLDAQGLGRLLDRLRVEIEELEAQNEGGEEASPANLPEELADKEALREQVRQAVKELAGKDGPKHINLTDQDARMMRTRLGITLAYNAQTMVSPVKKAMGEGGGMMITAVDLVDDPVDVGQLGSMLEKAEEITGVRAETTLADAGYHSGNALSECARREQQVVMPESQERMLRRPYHKDRFTYDEESDSYTGSETEFQLYQAGPWTLGAGVPGPWGGLPGVSGLRSLHQGRQTWAGSDSKLQRNRTAKASGLDDHSGSHRVVCPTARVGGTGIRDHQRGAAGPKVPAAGQGQRDGRMDLVSHGLQPAHPVAQVEGVGGRHGAPGMGLRRSLSRPLTQDTIIRLTSG